MGLVKITKPKDIEAKSRTRKIYAPNPDEFGDYSHLIDDPKSLDTFVKKVKNYIRNSIEYKSLMRFLKERKGLDRCGYHHNITYPDFDINIHHYPFTITDIIYTIFYKQCEQNEYVTMSSIAEEVMRIHYLEIIGLYPFCETCHEYTHDSGSDNFIPEGDLYGSIDVFVDLYGQYMSEKLLVKYNYWKELDKGYKLIEEYIPEEIYKTYLYIEDDDENSLNHLSMKKLEELIKELENY